MRLILSLSLSVCGCAPKAPTPPPGPPPVALHLEPACDLVPSAGVEWVLDAKPRAVAELPDLIPAIALVVPETRFDAFTKAHGGIDVRQITDLCVGKYRESWLTVARTPIDPARVERTFADRMTNPGSRQVVVPNPAVVRVWGEVNGEPQQLVIFGREAIALEQGKAGPVRAAEAFAQNKLRRASPALRASSLAAAVERLGEAPVRWFAPGPFEGRLGDGLGGLLRASTAVAVSARASDEKQRGGVAVRIVLTGAWGSDAPAAAERLAAAVHVVSESPFGRLLGLDQPLRAAHVEPRNDALVVDVIVDADRLARGVHDALDAEITDILGR